MEDADLSFASLLLALRHSTDDADKKQPMPSLKPSLNFHKDFYQNSSYDNECSNAAESLTTLSSYSTDADSPLGNEINIQSSSIGWKRRSDPCISTGDIGNIEIQSTFAMKSSISAPRMFDFPGCGTTFQGPSSDNFRPSGFVDLQSASFRVQQNPDVKKICRTSSGGGRGEGNNKSQQKNKNIIAHSNSENGITDYKEKDENKEIVVSKTKNSRELKLSKKESKDVRDSFKDSETTCLDSLLVVCRSTEDQKEFDEKNEARLLKIARGRYKCSRCGALKTNHDCPIIEEYAGSVATQVERISLRPEEFLSGGMAGFSAALKTCNLLTVRSNYSPALAHSSSGYRPPCPAPALALSLSRSASFGSTLNRSMSSSGIGGGSVESGSGSVGGGSMYCGDTDNNTTNSNSDNDSDSKSVSRKDLAHGHSRSTDSEASSMPSLLPTSIAHAARSPHNGLSGLESKIGGMGVYSLTRNEKYSNAFQGMGSMGGKRDGDKDSRGHAYHLTYQSLSYSGNSSRTGSALSSPRDYSLPLPL